MKWKTRELQVTLDVTIQVPEKLPSSGPFSEDSLVVHTLSKLFRSLDAVQNRHRTDPGVTNITLSRIKP
jgi:hypothetical protein